MARYLLRRLLALIPTVLIASLIVFVSIRLVPGNVVDQMLAENSTGTSRLSREQLISALGLDRPLLGQYLEWLKNVVLDLDLGQSLWTRQPVTDVIAERLPYTLYLGTLSMLFALLIAVPVGIVSAVRQNTALDYIGRSVAITALAIPPFWLGTLIIVFPALWWGWAPTTSYTSLFDAPWTSFKQMSVPAIVLGIALSGITMRMMRTTALEVLKQDYIRTAWAKGLNEFTVVTRHMMKNALLPVVTIVGLQAPLVLGGAVVVEQIFVVPGMGQLLIEAVTKRDYPVITGIFLLVGVGVMLINWMIDMTYAFLDPKIRQG